MKNMRTIFSLLLLGVASCSKPVLVKNNDLENENLKGKVKSTYTEERYVKEKIGHSYFYGKIINKEIKFFNEYGLNTYACNLAPGDKNESTTKYEFDNQNRIKKEIDVFSNHFSYEMDFYYTKNCTSVLIDANDMFVRKTIHLYNQNRLVRTNLFLQNKKKKKFYLDSYITYLHNQNKQDSTITYYKFSKKRKEYIVYLQDIYLYDTKTKDLLNHENYDLWYHHEEPANVTSKKRKIYTFKNYQYKYDKYGNWIEKIVQENGALKGYKRLVNYYV